MNNYRYYKAKITTELFEQYDEYTKREPGHEDDHWLLVNLAESFKESKGIEGLFGNIDDSYPYYPWYSFTDNDLAKYAESIRKTDMVYKFGTLEEGSELAEQWLYLVQRHGYWIENKPDVPMFIANFEYDTYPYTLFGVDETVYGSCRTYNNASIQFENPGFEEISLEEYRNALFELLSQSTTRSMIVDYNS